MMFKSFWTKLQRQFAIICLMVILSATIVPLTIFILLPVSLVLRLIVQLMAAVFRPDLHQIFRGKGAPLAIDCMNNRPTFNILVYQFCDGPMLVDQFRLQFEQCVLNYTDKSEARPYEKLMQTWSSFMGFIFWKWDKNFKLENHIRLYDYTEPELALPAKCTEDDLRRITGELVARPWIEGRSPWEILIVPDYRTNKEPEKTGSVALLRVHHAMIDGYSILTMILRFSDSLNVKRVLPNFPKLSPSQRLTHPLLLLLKLPYDLAELAVNMTDGWSFLWKPLSRKLHAFFSDEIDVETMKKIRQKYGVDYNATIYSITCGSIRRLTLAAGQELPESLAVVVPFPLPNHPGGLVVHVSTTTFKWYPRVASAQERIRQIGANIRSLQDSPTGPTTTSWLVDIISNFPIWLLRFLNDRGMTTVGMTSIPGPEVPVPMVGETKLTGLCWTLGHISNTAAVGAMMTMCGKQRIVLTFDKTLFEGRNVPTRFAHFVNQEIQDLLN